MGTSLCVQDHVVILLSPQEFENLPSWLSDNFNILEGGVHAGQSSRNKLIILADGTYLELFCWINTPREFHAWADKPPGLVDFALTSMPPLTALSLHNDVQSRLKDHNQSEDLDLSYSILGAGGRSKQDGVRIEWQSSRPSSSKSVNRTDFPFFCHDVTPRNLRVPSENSEMTKHPCGAIGISNVEVLVPDSEISKYTELYRLILGAPSRTIGENSDKRRICFELALPNKDFGVSNISLRPGEDETDRDWLQNHGTGISALFLSAKDRQGHGQEALGPEETASSIFLRW